MKAPLGSFGRLVDRWCPPGPPVADERCQVHTWGDDEVADAVENDDSKWLHGDELVDVVMTGARDVTAVARWC